MAAGFDWGAMFKGIGDTFTAGSNVNKAQISERMAKLDRQLTREEIAAMSDADRLDYVMQSQKSEKTIILVIVVVTIIAALLIMIFKK